MKNKKIGILNRGRNNTFIKNKFTGLDIGIQDEGKNTLAAKNKFDNSPGRARWYQKWWGILILGVIASAIVAIGFYLI